MSNINITRVLLGGLLAGLIINASEFVLNMFVLGGDLNAQMAKMNLPPISGTAIAVYTVFGFLLGIVTVWLYAAIRPRYGAGPTTALIAGATVWFLAYVYGFVASTAVGMMTARIATIGVIWGLAEMLVAAAAGAYLYLEEAAPTPRATAAV